MFISKNKFNKLIYKIKTKYYKKQINGSEGSAKILWKTINEFTNNRKEKIQITEIQESVKSLKSETEIAECLNNYFPNVG